MSGSQANPVRRAAIAGAGTSGLIAALLLHRLGWEVTVVEAHARARTGTRAPTLWPPALHVLGLVGVAGKVMAEGHPVSSWGSGRRPVSGDSTWARPGV